MNSHGDIGDQRNKMRREQFRRTSRSLRHSVIRTSFRPSGTHIEKGSFMTYQGLIMTLSKTAPSGTKNECHIWKFSILSPVLDVCQIIFVQNVYYCSTSLAAKFWTESKCFLASYESFSYSGSSKKTEKFSKRGLRRINAFLTGLLGFQCPTTCLKALETFFYVECFLQRQNDVRRSY